jgi:triosephosphate isomerase
MNLSFAQAKQFLIDFKKQGAQSLQKSAQSMSSTYPSFAKLNSPFCFFPQAVHAPLFEGQSDLNWGAQDFYFAKEGAFTGQNSPDIFKELGANVMLIGHSERRTLFHESDQMIAQKIKKCDDLNLIPMLCIGETLIDREKGLTLKVIEQQLQSVFSQQLSDRPKDLIIAYEPVWAIGTGRVASVEDVKTVHDYIKKLLGQKTPVLYGGSVKPDNAKELSSLDSVNGFLIGGASLKVESLLSIYNNSVKD